jgi:predicted dehydrogenase
MTYVEDPRTAPPIRWGILGPGGIAHTFATAVNTCTRAQLVAVGSRNKDRAERFATQHGIPTTHVGYEALVEDPQVDAVYVASPHSEHREHALLAIAAGKHVLVEKAFARNAAEAQEVVDAARAAGVFCMEAMWTRFLPHVVALRSVLARGDIGTVVGLIADHGQAFAARPATHRIHNPELAGGALLDLGVYPVSFAHDLLGVPDTIMAVGSLTPTGVDAQISIALGFGPDVQASLHTTSYAKTATTAVIFGQEGRIEIAGDFYRPTSFTVTRDDGSWWSYDREVDGGFQYQAAEVARRIAAGEKESPVITLDNSLEVMRTLDEIRRQAGVVYPGE